jgi:hypothetical protein
MKLLLFIVSLIYYFLLFYKKYLILKNIRKFFKEPSCKVKSFKSDALK